MSRTVYDPPRPTAAAVAQGYVADDGLGAVLLDAWCAVRTPLLIVDDAFELVFANPAAIEAEPRLAAEGSRVLREPLSGITAPCGAEITHERRPLVRALAGESVTQEEFVVPSVDGTDRPHRYLVSAYPLERRRGRRLVLMSWTDVTHGWMREHERQAAVDQLTRLVDGADEHAILALDSEGRVLTWSRSAQRLKGYDEADVLGQPYSVFFTAEDRAAGVPESTLREAVVHGRAVTKGLRVRRDGTTFWSRGVLTAIRDGSGALDGFVKVTQDVTEEHLARTRVTELNAELEKANRDLARVNEQLHRTNADLEARVAARTSALERRSLELADANSELEAFSYSVSHDLRAPLRAVAGFGDLLAEDYSDRLDEDGLRYLSRIREAATAMGELMDGLLRLARIHRQPLRTDVLDIAEVVHEAWADAGADAGFEFQVGVLPPARGDRQLMLQVWRNLLSNAVKYSATTQRPRVEVTGSTGHGAVTYTVRDNGVGFDPDLAGGLFTPFQRLHSSRDFPGTGLGLALVSRIVHRHGGHVSASSSPGQGAAFTITLDAP